MPTHQVEEYFLHMGLTDMTPNKLARIEAHLADEGWSSYEFQDNDLTLVVDCIPSEHDGDILESEINQIIESA